MAVHILTIAAFLGLALSLFLVLIARLRLQTGQNLWKLASLFTSTVGATLIIVIVIIYCVGTTNLVDAMQNGFFNTEDSLRHWFHGLSPR